MDSELKKRTVLKYLQGKFDLFTVGKEIETIRFFKTDIPAEMEMTFDEIGHILVELARESNGVFSVGIVGSLESSVLDFLRREQAPIKFLFDHAYFEVLFVNKAPKRDRGESIYEESKEWGYVRRGQGKPIKIAKSWTRQCRLAEIFHRSRLGEHQKKWAVRDAIKLEKDKSNPNIDWDVVIDDTLTELNQRIAESKNGDFAYRLREDKEDYWLEIESLGGK